MRYRNKFIRRGSPGSSGARIVTSTVGVIVIFFFKRLRKDSLTMPMAVEALIVSLPLSPSSEIKPPEATSLPKRPWDCGRRLRTFNDYRALQWRRLRFALLGLAFVSIPRDGHG